MAGEILIVNRSTDMLSYADRLVSALRPVFGERAVRASWPPTADPFALDKAMGLEPPRRVMLLLIGRMGVDALVHDEIANALSDKVPVIPVLVGGAPFPRPSSLPSRLMPLVGIQSIKLLDGPGWQQDVERLIDVVRQRLASASGDGQDNALEAVREVTGKRVDPSVFAPLLEAKERSAHGRAEPAGDRSAARAHDVFISYAFEDQEWGDAVVEALERGGCRCWIASRAHDIPPGTASYARAITKAIKASRIVVVIVSEHSNGSDDVLNEIAIAKNSKVPRLPFRVDASPLDDGFEYFFSQSQHLNVAGLSRASALDALVASVSRSIR